MGIKSGKQWETLTKMVQELTEESGTLSSVPQLRGVKHHILPMGSVWTHSHIYILQIQRVRLTPSESVMKGADHNM